MRPARYEYATFCANVQAIHGNACWIAGVSVAGRARTDPTLPRGWVECHGPIDGCHLIPKRLLRREFPLGAVRDWRRREDDEDEAWEEVWRPCARDDFETLGDAKRPLVSLLHDGRNGVPGCRKHHYLFDNAVFKIRLDELPPEALEFAAVHGLDWYLHTRAFAEAT